MPRPPPSPLPAPQALSGYIQTLAPTQGGISIIVDSSKVAVPVQQSLPEFIKQVGKAQRPCRLRPWLWQCNAAGRGEGLAGRHRSEVVCVCGGGAGGRGGAREPRRRWGVRTWSG